MCLLAVALPAFSAELKSGPPLPYHPIPDWAKLPKGWTLGETSGVAVDKSDHVWVFNRGTHPVIEFNRDGLKNSTERALKHKRKWMRLKRHG